VDTAGQLAAAVGTGRYRPLLLRAPAGRVPAAGVHDAGPGRGRGQPVVGLPGPEEGRRAREPVR